MKTLVTGGCGFIGSHIVDLFVEHGFDVAVVDNLATGSLNNIEKVKNKIQLFECELLSEGFEKAVEQFHPDVIVHQAAQVSVEQSISNLMYDANVNILGSIKVIDLARKYKVKKLIYSSSAAVYGEPKYLPIDIHHPVNPLSPYGISKLTVEHYLKVSKSIYGIDYVILRYGNVFGPRQDSKGEGGVISIFTDLLSKGRSPTIFGDGEQTRDFIFVEDVSRVNLQAILYPSTGIFNVSSGKQVNLNQLITTLNKIQHTTIRAKYEKGRLGEIRSSSLCIKRTKELLNWSPTTDFETGLKRTLEYYKNQKIL
jgi:UDP-glucose 4-epimerase